MGAWTNLKAVLISATGSVGQPQGRMREIYCKTSTAGGTVFVYDAAVTILAYELGGSSQAGFLFPDAGFR